MAGETWPLPAGLTRCPPAPRTKALRTAFHGGRNWTLLWGVAVWVTPLCLLWLWGHSPWPCTQIALVSRADSGISGACPQGHGQDGPQEAGKGGSRGGGGWLLGKEETLGIQTGLGLKLTSLPVREPQLPYQQNGNHNSYLTGWL